MRIVLAVIGLVLPLLLLGCPGVHDDDTGDDDDSTPADCSLISQANPAWEVCVTGPDFCAGVFTDGAGCQAYCAPAGLTCTARYGGEPGCSPPERGDPSRGSRSGATGSGRRSPS